jgi:phage terminase Nu1 subunit (DNA packaging protein)
MEKQRTPYQQLSEKLKVSVQQIYQYNKKGYLVKDSEGRILVEESAEKIKNNRDYNNGGKLGSFKKDKTVLDEINDDEEVDSLLKWKIEVERTKALKQQLELDTLEGKLVNKEVVESFVFEIFRTVRDALYSLPYRSSFELIGLTDRNDIEEHLRKQVDNIIEQTQNLIEEKFKDGS